MSARRKTEAQGCTDEAIEYSQQCWSKAMAAERVRIRSRFWWDETSLTDLPHQRESFPWTVDPWLWEALSGG